MARTLISQYNFTKGFFTCDSPIDTIELVLKIKTKLGKHTLKEDREKRTEKYQPWERCTNDNDNSLRRRLEIY